MAARGGGFVYNLHGDTVDVADVVRAIEDEVPTARGRITVRGPRLPIPPRLDDRAIRSAYPDLPHTPLADGVRATIARFRELHAAGRLDASDLPPG